MEDSVRGRTVRGYDLMLREGRNTPSSYSPSTECRWTESRREGVGRDYSDGDRDRWI
jgi:hypothetical protein